MSDQPPRGGDAPETDRERRKANLVLFAIFIVVLGSGLWLGNALLDARRADECMSSGRRNCAPVSVPAQPRR
jgi:hypothetical protein